MMRHGRSTIVQSTFGKLPIHSTSCVPKSDYITGELQKLWPSTLDVFPILLVIYSSILLNQNSLFCAVTLLCNTICASACDICNLCTVYMCTCTVHCSCVYCSPSIVDLVNFCPTATLTNHTP